jgi:Arginase/agmatinase/formimionoglutamate hydrolase, arginase family
VTLRFLLVPQWQGSPSSRAMRLAEGVAALRSDLPPSATTEIDVPLEAGDEQGTGIARYGSLRLVHDRITAALAGVDGPAVVVGGDCAVAAASVESALHRHPEACVVWFDAHPDLNSPASSPSGAFAGMVLRAAIDAGDVPASRVVLAGARSWDDGERAFADEAGIRALGVDELDDPAALVDAVAATGADAVYFHVDLDVLDPAELDGLLDPEPFGMRPAALVAALKALRERFPLAGASLAAYAPAAPDTEQAADDAATILRIIAALG